MCQICTCFGWGLDMVQRIVTLVMACIMCLAICIGMLAVIGAGIAYGYNFLLAESIDTKRADVTVYVRRGQYADRPEVRPIFRRSGQADVGDESENELFASNYSIDYQDQSPHLAETKPLANSWQKVQETKNYAERLTKYDKIKGGGGGAIRNRAEDDETEAANIKPQREESDFVTTASRPTKSQSYAPSRRHFESEDPFEPSEEHMDFNADPYDQANLPAMRGEDVKRYTSRNVSLADVDKVHNSPMQINSTDNLEDNDLEQDFSGYKPI